MTKDGVGRIWRHFAFSDLFIYFKIIFKIFIVLFREVWLLTHRNEFTRRVTIKLS